MRHGASEVVEFSTVERDPGNGRTVVVDWRVWLGPAGVEQWEAREARSREPFRATQLSPERQAEIVRAAARHAGASFVRRSARCPRCDEGSASLLVRLGGLDHFNPGARTTCVACGHRGRLRDFLPIDLTERPGMSPGALRFAAGLALFVALAAAWGLAAP